MTFQPGGQQHLKSNPRRFVILDRDGTIIVDKHYLSDPDGVELLPGAADGLRRLQDLGLGLIVITNQSGVGRSLFDRERVDLIHQRLCLLLEAEGIHLDGIYVCPHKPEGRCLCRKPQAGLLAEAAIEHGFDPKTSFVIGDQASDIALGQQVGANTFLVRTGYGEQRAVESIITADYVVGDVQCAAQRICGLLSTHERQSGPAMS